MTKQRKMRLIKYAINQRAVPEGNWALTKWQRYFFTAKAIVCVALGLEAKPDRPRWIDIRMPDDYFWNDPVTVAMFDYSQYRHAEGDGANWTELQVGHDWRDWRYTTSYNGYP